MAQMYGENVMALARAESLSEICRKCSQDVSTGELNEAERKPRPIQLTSDAGSASSRRRRFPRVSRDLSPIRPRSAYSLRRAKTTSILPHRPVFGAPPAPTLGRSLSLGL